MPSPATQRMMVRTLLSLPTSMLRLMSGGGVVYQGGRTLDPRLQFLAARARNAAPMETLPPGPVETCPRISALPTLTEFIRPESVATSPLSLRLVESYRPLVL